MGKVGGYDLTDMIRRLTSAGNSGNCRLLRLYKVYHPVYEISVNIYSERKDENYHIIEKYMDKLVCGYRGDDWEYKPTKRIIKDKEELFQLLGLDRDAYEVAEIFFQDLLDCGHFQIRKNGIFPLQAGADSVKLKKKVIPLMEKQKKLFDQYRAELLPSEFYDLITYAKSNDNAADAYEAEKGIWLSPLTDYMNDSGKLDLMLNNPKYRSEDRIDRGLPTGYKGMEISAGEQPMLSFFPYYLGVYSTSKGEEYRAYRVDTGKEIPWMTDNYTKGGPGYDDAIRRIRALAERCSSMIVRNPVWPLKDNKKYNLRIEKKSGSTEAVKKVAETRLNTEAGVNIDAENNYVWQVRRQQLKDALGLSMDRQYKKSIIWKVAHGRTLCISGSEDIGKLVYVQASPLQIAACKEALKIRESDTDDRDRIYMKYCMAEIKSMFEEKDREKEFARLKNLFKNRADKGDVAAMYEYAYTAESAGDEIAAEEYYRKAAEKGNKNAQYHLALNTLRETESLTKCTEAEKWMKKSADQGHDDAQYRYGKMKEESDPEIAFRYYLKAADQGHIAAQNKVGRYYKGQYEQVVPRSNTQARKYYYMAAEQGDATAQWNYAALINANNPEDALKYLKMSAAQGFGPAVRKLKEFEHTKESGRKRD